MIQNYLVVFEDIEPLSEEDDFFAETNEVILEIITVYQSQEEEIYIDEIYGLRSQQLTLFIVMALKIYQYP